MPIEVTWNAITGASSITCGCISRAELLRCTSGMFTSGQGMSSYSMGIASSIRPSTSSPSLRSSGTICRRIPAGTPGAIATSGAGLSYSASMLSSASCGSTSSTEPFSCICRCNSSTMLTCGEGSAPIALGFWMFRSFRDSNGLPFCSHSSATCPVIGAMVILDAMSVILADASSMSNFLQTLVEVSSRRSSFFRIQVQ